MVEHKEQGSQTRKNDFVETYRRLFNLKDYDPTPVYVTEVDIENLPASDFPHSMHHIETVRNFSKLMAEKCELEEGWRKILDDAVTYHDIAQGYTVNQPTPIESHASLSAIIAYMFIGDIKVSQLINSHNRDLLGESLRCDAQKDTTTRILRDADQLSHMGYSGLIRAAYYWGFRHKSMEDDPKAILNSAVLCDSTCDSAGLPDNYEEKVHAFTFKHLFPFLIETKQIDRAMSHTRKNFERFFGSHKPIEDFFNKLKHDKTLLENISEGKSKISIAWNGPIRFGSIQKIDERYSHLFIRKIFHDYKILDDCKYIQFVQANYEPDEAKRSIEGVLAKRTGSYFLD